MRRQQCQYQDQQRQPPSGWRRRALAAATLLCLSATGAYVESDYLRSLGVVASDDDDRRRLSHALGNGGCRVTYAKLAKVPIAPTWQASFPGSGSRMTWNLVEALTGIRTNDDYDSHDRGYEKVVAVKTHYPVKYARRGLRGSKRGFHNLDPLFGRAMVVLRNPMNAVPSYFNLQYEHANHLPNHSTRGPNREWLKYRDDPNSGLAPQLVNYERFVEYWMEKYERRQLLLLSYEDMTDGMVGPLAAGRIAQFLGEVEGVKPIKPEAVTCVWETVVNFKRPPRSGMSLGQRRDVPPPAAELRANSKERQMQVSGNKSNQSSREGQGDAAINNGNQEDAERRTHADPGKSLRKGPKDRPYTAQNLADMVALFRRLESKYSHDEEFVRIMQSYIDAVSNTVPREMSQQRRNPN